MLNVAAVQAEIEYRQQRLAVEAEAYRRVSRAGAVSPGSRATRRLRQRLHGLTARHAHESPVRAA